jgi:hypothetical protein
MDDMANGAILFSFRSGSYSQHVLRRMDRFFRTGSRKARPAFRAAQAMLASIATGETGIGLAFSRRFSAPPNV